MSVIFFLFVGIAMCATESHAIFESLLDKPAVLWWIGEAGEAVKMGVLAPHSTPFSLKTFVGHRFVVTVDDTVRAPLLSLVEARVFRGDRCRPTARDIG